MNHVTLAIHVPNDHPFPIHFYVGKPCNLYTIWTACRGVPLEIAQVGTSTTGDYVGSGITFELDVLQVMVVPAQIQVNFLLPQERFPLLNQKRRIAMVPVGEYRMVRENGRVQRRGRLGKFISKP